MLNTKYITFRFLEKIQTPQVAATLLFILVSRKVANYKYSHSVPGKHAPWHLKPCATKFLPFKDELVFILHACYVSTHLRWPTSVWGLLQAGTIGLETHRAVFWNVPVPNLQEHLSNVLLSFILRF